MPALLEQSSHSKSGGIRVPCEARAGTRTPSDDVRLSIAHTDGLTPTPSPHPDTFSTWQGASLVKFPAGENKNPNLSKSPPVRGKRGKITTLSRGARQRIKEELAKIEDVPCFTMALTLPEEAAILLPRYVHETFLRFCRAYTGTPRWDDVGIVYKREFQDNGRLHYHLAFYGLGTMSRAKEIQWWITMRWVRWVMEAMGGDDDGHIAHKMLKVHMHPKNMEQVRSTICSYFAKYLGKAIGAPRVTVPGKWWGIINRGAIPFVEEKQLVLPAKVRDVARRSASKLQSKRVQHGLFKSAMITANLVDVNREPLMSLQEFHSASQFRPSSDFIESFNLGSSHEKYPHESRRYICRLLYDALIKSGYRQGRHNRPRASKFGRITLVGFTMPATAERIIRHAAEAYREHLKTHPF